MEDNEGELAEHVGTRCGQLGSLPLKRRETLCSLEAGRDQVGSVVPSGVEGASAVDGCTESLGGMEAPGALEVTRFPSVNVPVCVVKGVSARPSVRGTACLRSLYVREMTVGMREHAAASPGVSVMEWCLSVVTRRCAWVERRRRRQMDKGRVEAIAILGTAPGLHGDEREVRAVQHTRPPRASLRE